MAPKVASDCSAGIRSIRVASSVCNYVHVMLATYLYSLGCSISALEDEVCLWVDKASIVVQEVRLGMSAQGKGLPKRMGGSV